MTARQDPGALSAGVVRDNWQVDNLNLRTQARRMTATLHAGQRVWVNDVLHVWEQLYARAREKGLPREAALDWAELAFHLVTAAPECWREPLSIRLLVISRFGHMAGHPLLDGSQLIHDALKHVPWTPGEIRTLFPFWREQTPDTIRQMGRTRNILAFLARLAEILPSEFAGELRPWLEVREAARMT